MQVVEAPWLTLKNLRLVYLLLESHQRAFNRPLHACKDFNVVSRVVAQEVFALESPLMAHGGGSDPLLIYANSSALRLWRRQWKEMVGMPSRLTAPVEGQFQREIALKKALQFDALSGYEGIRIDSNGKRFAIHDARIWTICNKEGKAFGQAATFSNWHLITHLQ